MRRPHRSIEVFDISLMAVVTKAMGAFLVLMLLLMPYYSSGPIGQQAADDLRKKVEQADNNIKKAISDLSNANTEDLRKLLQEALKQLEDARKLITELQRANDALNAQVRRLEDEKNALAAQVAQAQQRIAQLTQENADLKEQLRQYGYTISGSLANADCLDIGVTLGVWTTTSYQTSSDNKTKSNYVLSENYGLGLASYQTVKGKPGHGVKFNNAQFLYQGADPGRYMLVVTTRGLEEKTLRGLTIRPLVKASSPCTLTIRLQFKSISGDFIAYGDFDRTFATSDYAYAGIIGILRVSEHDLDLDAQPAPDELRWLKDQIDHALKQQ